MFDKLQTNLFPVPTAGKSSDNAFVATLSKEAAKTRSGNNAVKYSTSGNDFVDQFTNLGGYKKPRIYAEIAKDMQLLWSQSPELATKFTFYLRIITRQVQLADGSKVEQTARGGGLKHEAIMRMFWIYNREPKVFWDNLPLFISIGSWRDIFEMLRYDLSYHTWEKRVLDWNKMFDIIALGLENENTSELLKKYMPHVRARGKARTVEAQANTIIAKWLTSKLKLSYEQYRRLKSSGTAHEWQKVISTRNWDKLDFSSIHGRALSLLVSGKFLANNGLEHKYESWIINQPVAKYTGYPHELLLTVKPYQRLQNMTVDRQFMGLVEKGKSDAVDNGELIAVVDVSASMSSQAFGTNCSSADIAKGLALYFSYFLKGAFANLYIEFATYAQLKNWKGSTPTDKWLNTHHGSAGSTNVQSVIDLFCQTKRKGVAESEFPRGIVCISDGEFNPSHELGKTNVEAMRNKLLQYDFSKEFVENFKIILWDIPNSFYSRGYFDRKPKYETNGEVKNVFYFSGYDGAILAFLTGIKVVDKETGETKVTVTPKDAVELFEAAMNQEVLQLIKI